jgi:hypothetical protein
LNDEVGDRSNNGIPHSRSTCWVSAQVDLVRSAPRGPVIQVAANRETAVSVGIELAAAATTGGDPERHLAGLVPPGVHSEWF